ncbi:sulfotransferase [Kaarinaea lacus]
MAKAQKKKSNKQFQQALQLHQRGSIAAAKEIYLQLQANDPKNAEVLHYLGLVEYQTGNLTKAIELIAQAIKLSPKESSYYSNLAMCNTDLGQFDEAKKNYQSALDLDARLIPALIGMGLLMGKQGNYKESARYLSSVVNRQPNHVTANVNYALTLKKLGKHKEALSYAKKAIKIDPNNAVFQNNLGTIYQDLGEFTEALLCFRNSLKLNPAYGKAFYHLALSKKFSENDEDMDLVNQSEQLVANTNVDINSRISFHFGLGKIYDDLKLWDKAFRQFKQGNSLVDKAYDATALHVKFNNIIQIFHQQWILEHSKLGCHDISPIFIVGMPRSGTTLVEQILTSHPDVYGIGESQAIPHLTNTMTSLLGSKQTYPYCINQLNADTVTELAKQYQEIVKESEQYQSDKRSVDKMTTNYMHLGLIVTLFPNAKIIHCTRDPLDICLSCYFQDFTDRPEFAYRMENIGHFYNEYERIIEYWRVTLTDHIFNINYSDVVNETENVVRALLEFCGLPWNENCLSFYESKRQIMTASKWQVKQPIYKQSLNRWKNYQAHLAPLQNTLNQQTTAIELANIDTEQKSKVDTRTSSNRSALMRLFSRFSS